MPGSERTPSVNRIRQATEQDAATLAELRYEFRAALDTASEPRPAFVARAREWMAGRLADAASGWHCWAAVPDDAVIGHVWLQRVEKIPNPVIEPEAHAYITNLYVRPAFRGYGLGSALLQRALAWCALNDIDAAFLWPTPESRSLYRRHGFTASPELMQRRRFGG